MNLQLWSAADPEERHAFLPPVQGRSDPRYNLHHKYVRNPFKFNTIAFTNISAIKPNYSSLAPLMAELAYYNTSRAGVIMDLHLAKWGGFGFVLRFLLEISILGHRLLMIKVAYGVGADARSIFWICYLFYSSAKLANLSKNVVILTAYRVTVHLSRWEMVINSVNKTR